MNKAPPSGAFTKGHLGLLRITLGLYLFFHLLLLWPYATEIFSSQGVFPSPTINVTYGYFPSILYLYSSPQIIHLFMGTMILLSFLFILGKFRSAVAFILWYQWVCLFHQNYLIQNPSIPYISWLLLGFSLIKLDDARSTKIIFRGAWVILALGYTISGLDKFFTSPSWGNGEAISLILNTPLNRDNALVHFFFLLPPFLQKLMTWLVLGTEILFLPLCIYRKSRLGVWALMTLLHLGILATIDFADLTIGMLIFHLFVFQHEWFPARSGKPCRVLVDGDCGLCNRLVRFLQQEDRLKILDFEALQERNLSLDTLRLEYDGKTYEKSEALRMILDFLGGIWRPISWALYLVPGFVLNFFYELVAKYRLKIFGKTQYCEWKQAP